MAEAALSSCGFIKDFLSSPSSPANLVNNHLGHAIAPSYHKRILPVIDHEQLYLSPVVGVNRPRRIDEGNSMFQGQTATRSDLGLIASRKGNGQPGGNSLPTTRQDRDLLIDSGADIHAGGLLRHIPWQRQIVAARQSYDGNLDLVNRQI